MLTHDLSLDELDRSLLEMAGMQERQMREQKLVLYAGASLLRAPQTAMMAAELSSMPFMGPLSDKEQPGASIVSELERFSADLACRVFGADWADVRLPSCTIANLAVFSFFARPGALMLGPAAGDGGHLSQRRGGTPSIVGLRVEDLPFDRDTQMLDEAAAVRQINSRAPSIVVLGRSVILGPDHIEQVVSAAHKIGAIVVYDASHVLGLIAGGVFPNPFEAGVDIVTSSTYKTLGGPAGGVVLGRDASRGEAFSQFLDTQMLANQNASRLPAIISAMRSCLPDTGHAKRIVDTAQVLKSGFERDGLSVLLPDRRAASHQVVVRIGSLDLTKLAMRNMETCGILVGRCPIPGFPGEFGLRFGSQVLTSLMLDQSSQDEVGAIAAAIVTDTLRRRSELRADDALATRTSLRIKNLLASAS